MSRQRVAQAVVRMRLKHVVITAVARDDLRDGGAEHFARTIEAVRAADPAIVIEVLTPDFHAKDECLQMPWPRRPADFQSQRRNRGATDAAGALAGEVSRFRSKCCGG